MSKHAEEMRRQRLRKRAKGIPKLPPTESPGKLLRRVPEEYPDVLQNIEFFLVRAWRDDPQVDDAAVNTALGLALSGGIEDQATDDPRVGRVVVMLEGVRNMRESLPDDAWRDCLLTVKQSVRRRSSCRRGDRGYLHFVSPFVP